MNETTIKSTLASPAGVIRRYTLALVGVLFVVIAAIGVVLPGIPTVGPLILASFLFTKSCPVLEEKLVRNKFFARFLPYLDGSVTMPLRAKLITIAIMWTSITISAVAYSLGSFNSIWLTVGLIVAGLIGTVFILRYGNTAE